MTLPIDLLFSSPNTETLNSPKTYVESLRSQLDNVFAVARNNLQTAQSTNRRTYASINKTVKLNFHRGELVWFFAPHKNLLVGGKRKLTRPWTGPYKIIRKLSPVNYEIRLDKQQSGGEIVVHLDTQ
jgi:hypothetical protein